MRYTTIIDVSEIPTVWRCQNAVMLYLYLCLKCGYHDDDRDKIVVSTRGLAVALNMTHAAIRHALQVLEGAKLIRRKSSDIVVTKFVLEKVITPRPKKASVSVGNIVTETKTETKVNGFLDYYHDLQFRAAKGDAEAAAALERHKTTYERMMKKA